MTTGPAADGARRPSILLRHLDRGEEYLGVALLVVLGVMLTAQVFMRFVLGLGYSWMEEIIRMLFVWVIFIGAAAAMRRNLHIRVRPGRCSFQSRSARSPAGSVICCSSPSAQPPHGMGLRS